MLWRWSEQHVVWMLFNLNLCPHVRPWMAMYSCRQLYWTSQIIKLKEFSGNLCRARRTIISSGSGTWSMYRVHILPLKPTTSSLGQSEAMTNMLPSALSSKHNRHMTRSPHRLSSTGSSHLNKAAGHKEAALAYDGAECCLTPPYPMIMPAPHWNRSWMVPESPKWRHSLHSPKAGCARMVPLKINLMHNRRCLSHRVNGTQRSHKPESKTNMFELSWTVVMFLFQSNNSCGSST